MKIYSAKLFNFKGLVISGEFELAGSFDISVRMESPKRYPTSCGDFENGGYRETHE